MATSSQTNYVAIKDIPNLYENGVEALKTVTRAIDGLNLEYGDKVQTTINRNGPVPVETPTAVSTTFLDELGLTAKAQEENVQQYHTR